MNQIAFLMHILRRVSVLQHHYLSKRYYTRLTPFAMMLAAIGLVA